LNSPLILLVLLVYIQNKEGNQVSQFPPGNFTKSGDLLLDRRRGICGWSSNGGLATNDNFLCYEWWPSSPTSGGLPQQRPWSCKMVQTHCSIGSPKAHPGGHGLQQLRRTSCWRRKVGLLNRDGI
jgi:hypothetical protein